MISRKRNKRVYEIGREIAELKRGMDELGINYGQPVLDRFKIYLEVLYLYHGKIHLLSHQDYKRISRRHLLPSLMALPEVEVHSRVCDVGSGAGFPSVPSKILLPNMDLVIFEAQRKKADFLQYLLERLELRRFKIMNARAEEHHGAKFDLALLRAVGKIGMLVDVLNVLLEAGGAAIFFKTASVEEEIDEAQKALHKHNFQVSVKKMITPLEKLPLALVTLRKS